jgi:PAS domain S-box-containing protein
MANQPAASKTAKSTSNFVVTLRGVAPYLVALAALAASILLRQFIEAYVGPGSPFFLFGVIVILVSSIYGWGPGLFTVVISTLAGDFFFIEPRLEFGTGHDSIQKMVLYALQALIMSVVCCKLRDTMQERQVAFEGERTARAELQETANALQSSEARHRGIIATIPEIVFIADDKFGFTWLSDRWTTFTGADIARSMGELWMRQVHPDDVSQVHKEVLESTRTLSMVGVELRLADEEAGEFRWYKMRAAPVRSGSKKVSQWIGSFTDIHDGKLVEQEIRALNEDLELRVRSRTEELIQLNRSLESANQELEAFCYSVSHDLRAPLRGIDGFAKALEEDCGPALPQEGHGYLDRIRIGAKRMDELITALLKLSRIARQEVHVQFVDVTELAADVWSDLAADRSGRTIEFVVSEDLATVADSKLARIVFDNLLCNAIKFTGKAEQARVEVGLVDSENGEAFYVRDNGAGFNPEYSAKLFAPFERLHSARDYPGSGIGLATVQRCVHRHGGLIWAESAVGEGATFYFTFGRSKVSADEAITVEA